MARAIWRGRVIAESDDVEIVEGNVYFPRSALRPEYFAPSNKRTTCWWKGVASYYDVVVDGGVNANAAWYYPEPLEAAAHIRDRIAFWHGVRVER